MLDENIKELIDMVIEFNNMLNEEFGENDYYNEKIINLLKRLNVEAEVIDGKIEIINQ